MSGTRRAIRLIAASAALLVISAAAQAQGFATHDLAASMPAVRKAFGAGYIGRAAADRLTLTCGACQGAPIVDVQLGRQTDGTEQRVRSGATTVGELERLCRAREPRCRLARLEVAPAIGWVSAYPLGQGAGATAIVVRDGDLLTIRAIARTDATARQAIDTLLPVVRARIVGR